ncbi:Serine/threonine-protein kinase tel1 [Paecilomyces lecythidis]
MNDPSNIVSDALYVLVSPIVEVLEQTRQSQPTVSLTVDAESMDLDDPFSERTDQQAAEDSITEFNREAVPILPDNTTFRRFMTVQLSIFYRAAEATLSNSASNMPLVEYLTSLDESDILSAQDLLPKVFAACIPLGRAVVLEILEYIGERCLQSYLLERCESALYLCIRMMGSFVEVWTKAEEDDLHDSASDMYIWFTDVLLARKKASPRVLIALAELFQGVLASNSGYERNDSGPSPRTSLFNILREGDVSVKFFLAKLVPSIFSRFLLADHDAVFDDVLDSLPRDPDWIEGIAVRLYALAQLASQWHTLLRRSIYHMFEAPGQVPQSAPYAEKCLKDVSEALALQDAKEIFRLFASQIIYTWTETQSITSMPFTIFGYTSLKDMLLDVQDEVVGQIMMRANDQEASEASVLLGAPFTDLLSESFHKAEAYTIARDISIPPSQNSQPKGVEKRIKSALGTNQFINLVESHFPQVVATLFRSLDKEEQIERAFGKRAHFHYALETLKRITDKGASAAVLPANPQPSFRARYLLDELEFLCRRSGYDLETMWTPALASFVCRTLLESMHPSLGSLYACSVIRKVRILVCIAGPVMLQDYPLELCLHALRPLLTDSHCCEDALGIFWYLLEAGQTYLSENPGFTAGIAVLTLSSLSRFLSSGADSSSQVSQYRVTSSKVGEFRNWLGGFLENYKASSMDERTEQSFQRMIRSSQGLRVSGNPTKGTHESDLLFELLQDRTSGRNLVSRPISDLVISLVGEQFQKSPDFRSDILGEDTVAAANAVAVWETVRSGNPGNEYQLWAARVIGRAYASTGKISDALLREQDPDLFKDRVHEIGSDPYSSSKIAILQILCEALPKGSALEGGLVERTLQVIMSKLPAYPELEHCVHAVPGSLMRSLIWDPYQCPAISLSSSERESIEGDITWNNSLSVSHWARSIALSLVTATADDPVIGPLGKVLYWIPHLSVRLLPYILHDVLLLEVDGDQTSRRAISEVFRQCLCDIDERSVPHARLVINTILYLRNQPKPYESTIVDRDEWLDIDYGEASLAATRCRMYKTSLLFAEIQASRSMKASRRSSAARQSLPVDLLHDIFRNLDDPDSFYGIQQEASLRSVMEKLDYESAGIKNLLFQSAQYDSDVQMLGEPSTFSVIKALNSTNLQGLASAMLSSPAALKRTSAPFESMLSTAMSLQQWDIPVPSSKTSPTGVLFKMFQGLSTSESGTDVPKLLDESFITLLDHLGESNQSVASLRGVMKALGILTEVDEVLCSSSSFAEMEEELTKIRSRETWFKWESFHDIDQILHCREALFSLISHKDHLKSALNLSSGDTNLLRARVIKGSLNIARDHQVPQASLRYAISLSKLAQVCDGLGVNIDGSAKFDLANVLWDQGEMTTSIQMLQQVNEQNDLHKQAIPVSRALLLSSLGHHVAEARLEKPEAIIQEYLVPAVKELKSNLEGEEPGHIFHVFATFCDQQLQNPDSLEDFKRVEQLRDRKEKEVIALEKMMKTAEGRERETLKIHRTKAKQWFELDDRDYQRLKKGREAFLQQCLENYLLSLEASDTYNNDALRFCALWLDNSDSQIANAAVSKYISQVPSRKFAPLMNQISSRLLDVPNEFQTILFNLLFRICVEHPYHGMYQIFASSKSKAGKDETSVARHQAAGKLVDKLKNDRHAGPTWVAIHNTNISYVRFAIDRPDEKTKSGAKVPLKKLATGQRLEQDATNLKLPPPTMRIELRADCNYKDVPKVVRFNPEFTVASGVSAPKIITAIASNGQRYKQLVKGGNDDLRQDAIMEQVFEQVSNLLKDHRATQQRSLGIRTYKVLPLTSNAGIIEFVPNTIPLHDYLMPAHQKYFPKDMKPNACRKHISDVQTRSFEQRVRTFRQVTDHFHPVMRFFFMEKFNNPDDWFGRRLAYTRSTAAISILGHVLGLGDRHGHNILLDEKTGEVVHIDLGVAFEQGRVLPVPEVVPFRLTRDLVDGMGITKTEGVFRRCCEFTLEALREESYSIMTILDVLRYDPLYSWTVSPLRMKRMQETQEAGGGAPQLPVAAGKGTGNEPSEADRALTVVEKKLSKTLSVTATVNELIQQATDERNLAVLYCGWAAYA